MAHNAPAYKFNISFGFGDPDFQYGTDVSAMGGHLPCDLDL